MALVLLALPALLLLAPYLAGLQVLYYRDIVLTYEAEATFFRASLAAGQLPLWNPLLAGGYPQWASMEPSFLYPPNILFYYLEYPVALSLQIALHLVLAAWGTYALGRELRWRRPAAALAACSYGLGGALVSCNCLHAVLQFAALLPLAALALHRLWRRPGPRPWLVAAAAFALLVATNRPDFTAMSLLILGAHALHAARQSRSPAPLLQLAGVAAAAVLANAATVLPALEFIRHSNHQRGLDLAESQLFSWPPLAALQLLAPHLFGSPETGDNWGRYLVGEPELAFSQWFLSLYAGMGAYLFAGYALLRGRRLALAWPLAALAALGVLLALGRYGLLYGWFQALPPFSFVRYPVKYMFMWVWATTLLAGLGADAWLREPGAARGYLRAALALAGLGLAALAASWATAGTWVPRLAAADWTPWLTGPPDMPLGPYLAGALPAAVPRALLAAALPLAFLAVLAWLSSRGPLLAAAMVAVAAVDLYLQARPVLYPAPPGFYTLVPPAVAYLRAHEPAGSLFRLHHGAGDGSRDPAAFLHRWSPRQPVTFKAGVFALGRQQLAGLAPVSLGLASTRATASVLTGGRALPFLLTNLAAYRPATAPIVAGLMNIKYVQFTSPSAAPVPLREVFRDDPTGVVLYENPAFRPRVYCATSAAVAPGLEAAFRQVAEAPPGPDQVVLADDPALQATLALRRQVGGARASLAARCELTAYRNQEVLIEVALPAPAYVVLSDNYDAGWEVTVDNRARPLLSANVVGRAVWVEAGRHTVAFRYRPCSWTAGVLLSLLALFAWLLAWLLAWRLPRASPASSRASSSDSDSPQANEAGR